MNEFQAIKDERNRLLMPLKNDNAEAIKSLKTYCDNNFVEKCLSLIKFSLAVANSKEAKKIRKEAMQIVKDNRLRDIEMFKEKI